MWRKYRKNGMKFLLRLNAFDSQEVSLFHEIFHEVRWSDFTTNLNIFLEKSEKKNHFQICKNGTIFTFFKKKRDIFTFLGVRSFEICNKRSFLISNSILSNSPFWGNSIKFWEHWKNSLLWICWQKRIYTGIVQTKSMTIM